MFKAIQNTSPSSLQDLLTLTSTQCCKTSGYEFNFYKKYVSTTQKRFSNSYTGALLWNSSEMCLKQISTLSKFKKEYKKSGFTLCRKLIIAVIVLCFVLLYFLVLPFMFYV